MASVIKLKDSKEMLIMSKMINFIYYGEYYLKVLDSLIDPITKHLPEGTYQKTTKHQDDCLNISFF
jgi:hypothetical protein